MENGLIKWFDTKRGFGLVAGSNQELLFHRTDVSEELLALLDTNHYQDEPVVFEIVPSSSEQDKYQATQLTIDFSKRSVGYVVLQERDGERFPFAKDSKTKIEYPISVKHMKTPQTHFINFEDREGDPVIFTPSGDYAEKLEIIDNRRFILRFADFSTKVNDGSTRPLYLPSHKGYPYALGTLKKKFCSDESWNYIQHKTEDTQQNKTEDIPILISYIDQTFKRIIEEDKLVLGRSSDGKEYAYFNTGLANRFQSEVFAYFEKNYNYKESKSWGVSIPKWHFLEFNTEESRYRKYFDGRTTAQIASYFNPGTRLVLDPEDLKTAKPNWGHLYERKNRIAVENINVMSEGDFRDAISDSIDLAYRRIKRNYKTAIPQFYSHEIQFLVPLYSRKDRVNALAAMVIRQNECIYEISTLLTLDQAYNNARLLAKPDREWLNP